MALNAAAICQLAQGDQAEAKTSAMASVSLCRQLGDRRGLGRALATLGEAYGYLGDAVMACRHNEEALSLAREAGDRRDTMDALLNLALGAYQSGDLDAAQAWTVEALDLGHAAVGPWLVGDMHMIQSGIRREVGDLEGARGAIRESLKCYRECGHRAGIAMSLIQLVRVSLDAGDLASAWIPWREASDWMPGGSNYWVEWLDTAAGLVAASGRTTDAARLWGCVQRQREQRSLLSRPRSYVAMQGAARVALADDAAFDRALAEGRAWTLDEGTRTAWTLDAAPHAGR
jgi:tetratricopeptide (TPR) repeat protein